ncbi:MAG: hypothetical protein K0Q74_1576 [Gammaproteobacteria bacterium]|jgi:hypothetical protein|nr:hypothetical protein [Gammaproteobacteria bacterium]
MNLPKRILILFALASCVMESQAQSQLTLGSPPCQFVCTQTCPGKGNENHCTHWVKAPNQEQANTQTGKDRFPILQPKCGDPGIVPCPPSEFNF